MGVEIDERDRGKFAVDGGADYGVHLNMTISIERLLQFRCAERFVQGTSWRALQRAASSSLDGLRTCRKRSVVWEN